MWWTVLMVVNMLPLMASMSRTLVSVYWCPDESLYVKVARCEVGRSSRPLRSRWLS